MTSISENPLASSSAPQLLEPAGRKVLKRAGEDGVCMYRIPALVTTKAGSLVAAFDARYKSDADLPGEIDIVTLRSTDSGKTWSPMRILMGFPKDEPGTKGNGVGDPSLLADLHTGTLWAAGIWIKGDRTWDRPEPGVPAEESAQWLMARSDDDGQTWSSPTNLTQTLKNPAWNMAMCSPGRGIQLRDGTLVFPAYFTMGTEYHSFFIFSEDHGQTWHVAPPAAPDPQIHSDECHIVELVNGDLLISMNGRDALKERVWVQYHRNPANGGGSGNLSGGEWSKPWRGLADPGCEGGLLSPPDSRWILSSNPQSKRKREKLTISLSTDGGHTWPHSRLLADGGWCAYSCMTLLPDGGIGILYEYSAAPVERDPRFTEIRWTVGGTNLTFASFTLDWVMDGK